MRFNAVFLSHFERSTKILRKIAVNGEKCATDSIYKGFKCGTLQGHQNVGELRHSDGTTSTVDKFAGAPECW